VRVDTGLYGDCLNSLQRFPSLRGEACIAVIEWPDLDPRLGLRLLPGRGITDLSDILNNAAMRLTQFEHALRNVAEIAPVALALPTLPLPPVAHTPGWQAGAFELRLQENLFKTAAALAEAPRIRVVNRQTLDDRSTWMGRLDVKSALNFDFPYSLPHTDGLADLLVQAAIPPMPYKGIITDLDNTLWRGIIGEVGAEGVSWDLDHHSQIHGLYQQVLRSLAQTGTLIAIASKNAPEFAEEGLKRADLVLPLDRVFPVEIQWRPKSEAVTRILQAWNIGADSVIFVDDSPTELAEVQAAHPGLLALRFPERDDQAAYELIERLRTLCGKTVLSQEDSLRIESLRAAYERTIDTETTAHDPETFLRQSEPVLTVTYAKAPIDPRALELINKTNQFNLNGKRYTEGQWQAYLGRPDTMLMVASYEDRYGALGKIAVLAGRLDGRRMTIDTWVMSCRAFSRRIEYGCLQRLVDACAVDEISFDYLSTERNGPLQDFLRAILGAEPAPGVTLPSDAFLRNCPPHYFSDRNLP